MKTKENIYLDLSKLSGEEIKEVISRLPEEPTHWMPLPEPPKS